MLIFGIATMLGASGLGAAVCWANRNAMVHVHLAGFTWSGHLYGLFLAGAVLAGWFFLGAACIQVRLRERRERRSAARTARRTDVRPEAPLPHPAGLAR